MPDYHHKVKQQFEQLPDLEPPLGLDTRIKAQAKAELEVQLGTRARRGRWGAGFATAACAVLAVVIARPLLQQPLSHIEDLDSSLQVESADAVSLPPAAMESAVPRLESMQEFSSGGGTEPELRQQAQRAVATAKSKAARSAEAETDSIREEIGLSVQSLADTAVAIPALHDLLEQLKQNQNNGEADQIAKTVELIKRHYPEHKLDYSALNTKSP